MQVRQAHARWHPGVREPPNEPSPWSACTGAKVHYGDRWLARRTVRGDPQRVREQTSRRGVRLGAIGDELKVVREPVAYSGRTPCLIFDLDELPAAHVLTPHSAGSNRPGCCCGWDRRYWLGTRMRAPRWAAACHGHRGLKSTARASAMRSASPVLTIASACSNSVISPTATTAMDVASFTARARGT